LHLNLFDHQTGTIGLINTSLHGAPLDRRSRVLGTAVANVPGVGWLGNVEVHGFADAAIGISNIGLPRTALAIDHDNAVISASVRNAPDGFQATISARPDSLVIDVEEQLPLAGGWISWYVVPRLRATGTWTIAGNERDLENAAVYHDHNWGRWFWGDDFGWEWGCFLSPTDTAFVVARTTDRAHTRLNDPYLFLQAGRERRAFGSSSIHLQYEGQLSVSRRLPGAMAALHQDRAHPRLPRALTMHANDGIDELQLQFIARDALQLIAADPIAANGFTFIHEIVGEFSYDAKMNGSRISGRGLGIMEHVG
jgi:hypothetical protein